MALAHLCIGHTCLTHSSLMNGEDIQCVACNCDLTVEHIHIEYGDFTEARQRHYDAGNLRQVFQEISVAEVLDFLLEIAEDCLIEYKY